jgi:NADPH:quinone reductase
MRRGEWDEWNPITGLECVGVVEACPGGEVAVGQKVAGVMALSAVQECLSQQSL